jgi:arylsulfatase A-like enzyme
VLFGFVLLLAFENVAVGVGYRAEFASTWEMYNARLYLSPLALATSIPVAMALVAIARNPRPALVAAVGAVGGAAASFGVSGGRHLANPLVRVPFVLIVAALGAGVGLVAARRLPRLRDGQIAMLSLFVGAIAWLGDAFLFERLYPAFHLGLFAIVVIAAAGLVLPLRTMRAGRPLSAFAAVLALVCVAWAPHAAVRIAPQDNLRRVLLEHAPVLGQAVVVASLLSPPPPLEDDEAATTTLTSLRDRNGVHALDWRGHDIVLVTIDALRADHVSAYGYKRRTTPYIDALAQKGVRFEHAYCPTPHTSYSVSSMMTGKYMKSLLALRDEATGNDETAQDVRETWPVYLQRYGYRTAAFYPPAVFFIDEHRFRQMRDTQLGFEYAKVEFAGPALREQQITKYLQNTPKDKPLFLWVHVFEPHEPYEMHAEHPFSGDPRLDAYDSEIAEADDIVGAVYSLVNQHRPPGAIMIVSADHGEEHGDHGGRYHGTTVYEEQVRVPLVISVPGIPAHVVSTPVQTIDLLPTTLAALDIPIPPRLRGRDLGPAVAGVAKPDDPGLAFAETDDYTLVARADDRLVCARKIGSCTLFDVAKDPGEKHAVTDRPARVLELKKLTAAIERETGRVEASGLPEALRRGLQGDVDAAEDVAPLLDDSRVEIRRLAAKCGFGLKAEVMKSGLARALAKDEDADVKRWSALALSRMGDPAGKDLTEATLTAGNPEERVAAALALAEHGDGRGEGELVARWNAAFDPDAKTPGEVDEARALLSVFSTLKSKNAVPGLIRALEDLRIRPFIVETLGTIGDPRAKDPLVTLFTNERYVHLRPLEARALLKLGARKELLTPLTRFAGVPEPMPEALELMREAKLLTPENGGQESGSGPLILSKSGPARLLVKTGNEPSARINGVSSTVGSKIVGTDDLWVIEAGELPAGPTDVGASGVVWLVPRAEEIPPPAPKAWDAGTP